MANVLMVDDEPDMQLLVRQKFKKSLKAGKFDLFFADSGSKALEILRGQTIDVLVTDVNMPGMDGLTLLEKAQSYSPSTRSVIVSAYGDMDTLRKAMNRGAFDFVTKPVDFKQLEDVIDQSLATEKCPQNHGAPIQLASYQTFMKNRWNFPNNFKIEAKTFDRDVSWLVNAWPLDKEHIAILVIHATSTQLQKPFPVILAERNFHIHASTNSHETINSYLQKIEPSFTTQLCYGVLQTQSLNWNFVQEGSFQVSHQTPVGSHTVLGNQTSLLKKGDSIEIKGSKGPSVLIYV